MPVALSLRTSQRKKLLRYYRHHLDPSVRSRAHIILLLSGSAKCFAHSTGFNQ
jgi:hypothetical protein